MSRIIRFLADDSDSDSLPDMNFETDEDADFVVHGDQPVLAIHDIHSTASITSVSTSAISASSFSSRRWKAGSLKPSQPSCLCDASKSQKSLPSHEPASESLHLHMGQAPATPAPSLLQPRRRLRFKQNAIDCAQSSHLLANGKAISCEHTRLRTQEQLVQMFRAY